MDGPDFRKNPEGYLAGPTSISFVNGAMYLKAPLIEDTEATGAEAKYLII